MPDELLTIFKLCFLVLLYLFFFRVLRAVWTEVNAPAAVPSTPAPPADPVPAAKESRRSRRAARAAEAAAARAAAGAPPVEEVVPSSLVAVDPPQLAGIEYPLVDGMSIGRGQAASIVFEDSFLSQLHAAFELRDGGWTVSDLGSTNGTYVNRARLTGPCRLGVGDTVQVGNVVLDVR